MTCGGWFSMTWDIQFAGFLTGTFRSVLPRALPAFSGCPNGPLSRKGRKLHAYSTVGRPTVFRSFTGFPFSADKNACPLFFHWVAHLPQNKPDSMFTPNSRWGSRFHNAAGRARRHCFREGAVHVACMTALKMILYSHFGEWYFRHHNAAVVLQRHRGGGYRAVHWAI